jgi:aryl-alcohol dehydrogenase-like predicted oxidoreductase
MKYRKFGNSGPEVSEIGFGAWAIGGSWGRQSDKDSLEALETAIDKGVNFIDTAAGYGNGKSERIIGEFLKSRSEKVFVSTKTPPAPGTWPPSPYDRIEERYSEKYIRKNVEERMKNLQVESLDVLLLHTWTRAWNDNPVALHTLQQMKSEGLIRQIGISTPEHDQNCVIQLMREGMVDVLQVISLWQRRQGQASSSGWYLTKEYLQVNISAMNHLHQTISEAITLPATGLKGLSDVPNFSKRSLRRVAIPCPSLHSGLHWNTSQFQP